MKLRFLEKCQLEIVESCDEDGDDAETSTETFQQGEKHDVDVLDEHDDTTSWQFGDGSVVYGVPNSLFEKLDTSE